MIQNCLVAGVMAAALATVLFADDATRHRPLPARMMNVVPWGEGEQRLRTVNTVYLTDGWSPQLMRERLAEHGIDTIRVIFQSQMLDHGRDSRWFADVQALTDAGFKIVIAGMTHRKEHGPSFQPYHSKAEGQFPIADRTAENAPTWTRWIADWQLVTLAFADNPNVLGYEIFNEFSPVNDQIGPAKLYLRDIGGWMDAVGPTAFASGKRVWIQGLWATTSFVNLKGVVDDRGRTLANHFAANPGQMFPAIHVYNWYGPGFGRPESVEQVRAFLEDEKTPARLREALRAIVDEPDPDRARRMLYQYNFDRRWESTIQLIRDAREACGLGPETQVWMSECGIGVMSFSGDAQPDTPMAQHFRAIVRACNANNVSIAFWVDRGQRQGWGFFLREADAEIDTRRLEYREAFFDAASDPIDYLKDPEPLSVWNSASSPDNPGRGR